jgi:hypothetical protein
MVRYDKAARTLRLAGGLARRVRALEVVKHLDTARKRAG